jgi:hypothetical protein
MTSPVDSRLRRVLQRWDGWVSVARETGNV